MKRKEELRQANEVKNRKPDPDCPPNHVRLSEDERRRVLTNLQKCESHNLGLNIKRWVNNSSLF